ncbi:MAG: universal stress protein [Gallionella sp.]|jgi:nucleotide-binding universal stress UspA family protein|nr:universal stress protein [Gallionella sp.]
MKLLIPVDGSDNALRALKLAVEEAGALQTRPEILLLNVQWNVAAGNVKLFIDQETINDYYREQGETALKAAREAVEAAGLPYRYHISIGTPAEAIARYAAEENVDRIVMGRQGQGGLQSLLLGSVANRLLHLTDKPILLVK